MISGKMVRYGLVLVLAIVAGAILYALVGSPTTPPSWFPLPKWHRTSNSAMSGASPSTERHSMSPTEMALWQLPPRSPPTAVSKKL